MQRSFIVGIFALIIFLTGAGISVQVAHAQTASDGLEEVQITARRTTDTTTPAPNAATAQQQKAPDTATDGGPKIDKEFGSVMTFLMSLFAWLVGVAALTLDNAVYHTVVHMGSYVNGIAAVGLVWQIMRDAGNIILIFGFLAAGIATILNVDMYGMGKKMLPMLLLAAVLLNFSLFVAKAVIDAGNLVAVEVYTQINGGEPATNRDILSTRNIDEEPISNAIMGKLGLQKLYGAARDATVLDKNNPTLVGFLGIILFIVAAFVMFSLAFILIARFVILLFLIIIAPIGFAGLAVPKLKSFADKWWGTLFEQTITAPVLLLLLYIALRLILDPGFLGTNGDYTDFINNKNVPGFGNTILSFLVAMGALLFVTIAAKQLSAFGGGVAMKWSSKLSGASLALAAPGWAGRKTLGMGATAAARGLRKTAFARVPLVGTGIVKGLDKVGGASFDVRGTAPVKGLGAFGIAVGDAQKGGYAGDEKKAIEAREKYAATLKQTKQEKEEQKRWEGTEKSQTEFHKQELENLDKAQEAEAKPQEKEIADQKAKIDSLRAQLKNLGQYTEDLQIAELELREMETDPNRRPEEVATKRAKVENIRKRVTQAESANQQLPAAEQALAAQENALKSLRGTQKKFRDDLVEAQQKSMVNIKGRIQSAKIAPQQQYADNISIIPLYRNTEAAHHILDNAKKSKSEKELEVLRKALEKASHDEEHGDDHGGGHGDDHGGGHGPAPKAAPAAAPKAPAGGGHGDDHGGGHH